MLHALIGAIGMLSILVAIGITRPRRTDLSTWCLHYVIIAVSFDIVTVVALILQNQLMIETLLGVAAGAATGLAFHVWSDMKEVGHSPHSH